MNKTTILSLFFSLFLFLAEITNSDVTIFVAVVILLIDFVKRGIYLKDIRHVSPLLLIVLFGTVIGVLNYGFFNKDLYRDVYKTLSPVIFILLGASLYKDNLRKNDLFMSSVVLSGLFVSLRHIILVIIAVAKQGVGFEIIRGVGGNMSMVTILALVFCLNLKEELSNRLVSIRKSLCILFILSIMLYVSRTTLVVLIPFLLLFSFRSMNLKKVSLYGIYIILLVLFFKAISHIDLFQELINKFTKSFTEINSKYQSWDWLTINNNWRGYEIFLVVQQIKYADFFTKLFGFGFGALLDLGVYILLGDNYFSSIPILHNGYYYILYKVGIIGLLLLFVFFILSLYRVIKLCLRSNEENKKYHLFLIGCYVGIMVSMYVISGFYNGVSMISFCMSIGYFERKLRRMDR
ncbi:MULTISPECIES: hypothetical protein [unclassified Enterococcus]|uniref:hypothetical protein n=1 Tax=unclassified Enterococcus TaxID=2608891 RepID=UPI001CE1B63F|nr:MULTISPECIES: hypothetical protein [unclassified Enterococcus]MCA5014096.1 hypothetical protein [Enterococcus sp. S23]MCA5017130.1 hypothetical protein [Enterococcus sp. S22(2020)]